MAKVNLIDGPRSGSIGGATYSHNKGLAYVRRRSIPTNPNSIKQQAARQILSALSASWAGLSSANQTAWTDWASINTILDTLGQSIQLSGQQAYIQLNSRVVGAGGTAVATPPVGTGPTGLVTATAVATAPGTIAVTYTPTPMAAGQKLVVWATLPSTAGRNPNINQARLIGYSAAAAASPQSVTSPYTATAGQVSNLYVGIMDAQGRLSPLQKIRVTWA